MPIKTHSIPAAAAAAFLTACAATPQAAAEDPAPRTITVTGQGEVVAAPDMAVLNVGVQTEANTAQEALRQNSANMAATIKKLKDLGVADRDIQTSGLSINPRYDYNRNQSPPRVTGYIASNNVAVKLRDLDDAGDVIDNAVQSGANSIGGISFTFSEPKPLYEAARKDAVARAKAKAELLTDAAGVRLGKVLTITDGVIAAPTPQLRMARMSMAADESAPIQVGESTVSANVTIVYEIQ
ncbi:MAG: SIMPL domain-containing protein [Pseudomonadota bacterium]